MDWFRPSLANCGSWIKVLSVAALLVAAPAVAREEPAGAAEASARAATASGDCTEALRLWQSLARQGNSLAIACASLMYCAGWSGEPDVVAMNRWTALEKGFCGGPQYSAVMDMVRPLADKGDAHAQSLVGLMTRAGQGTTPDLAEALRWFRLSADQGDTNSQYHLGGMSEGNSGVPKDLDASQKWLRLAAAQGSGRAIHELGNLYFWGDRVKKDVAEGLRWYRLGAERGNTRSAYQLGWMYANKAGVPRDYAESRKWYLVAARNGDPEAEIHLGEFSRDGSGTAKDPVEAYKWFSLATFHGGEFTRREYFNYALDEFQKARKRILPGQRSQALLALGRQCASGDGVLKDAVAAHAFLQLATLEETDAAARGLCLREQAVLGQDLTPFEITLADRRLARWPEL